jgi:hypothetical protein
MPYIKQSDRQKFDNYTNSLDYDDGLYTRMASIIGDINDVGELNFVITCICQEYIKKNGLRYKHLNDVIGVLECLKLELYRKIGGPYEDIAIAKNGDVTILDEAMKKAAESIQQDYSKKD